MAWDNRTGIQWAKATVEWEGDGYRLTVPVLLDPLAALWLEHGDALRRRLSAALAENAAISVEVVAAKPTRGGRPEPGRIALAGLTPPWPNATELREVIARAVEGANEAAAKHAAEADSLAQTVRGAHRRRAGVARLRWLKRS